jgi:hypothetical protein
MAYISDEVVSAAASLGRSVRLFEQSDSSRIHSEISRRYLIDSDDPMLWTRMNHESGVQNIDGWKLVGGFLPRNNVILFFNPKDDPNAIEFESGTDIVPVISECFRFEFYLTNPEYSFLLCCNKYDFVIGAGDARPWVSSLPRKIG